MGAIGAVMRGGGGGIVELHMGVYAFNIVIHMISGHVLVLSVHNFFHQLL